MIKKQNQDGKNGSKDKMKNKINSKKEAKLKLDQLIEKHGKSWTSPEIENCKKFDLVIREVDLRCLSRLEEAARKFIKEKQNESKSKTSPKPPDQP